MSSPCMINSIAGDGICKIKLSERLTVYNHCCFRLYGKNYVMIIQKEEHMDIKRLVKSNQDRIFCGVCGGIGQYFGIDATLIRLVWVVFGLAGGSGLLAYILAAIIIPADS